MVASVTIAAAAKREESRKFHPEFISYQFDEESIALLLPRFIENLLVIVR